MWDIKRDYVPESNVEKKIDKLTKIVQGLVVDKTEKVFIASEMACLTCVRQ